MYEDFWFFSRFSKTIHSLCLNHLDVLENFILYIREHASSLFKRGEINTINWVNSDPNYCKIIQTLESNLSSQHNKIYNIKTLLKPTRYPINNGIVRTYLTPRELEVLDLLGKGFAYKEIGNRLQLSSRTIETHLQHIRQKLQVHSSTQLLKIYHNNTLNMDKK